MMVQVFRPGIAVTFNGIPRGGNRVGLIAMNIGVDNE
jgi:hypothetical protein